MSTKKTLLHELIEICESAGEEIVRAYHRKGVYEVYEKHDRTLLTEVDLEVDAFLGRKLRELWDVPIVSEENHHQSFDLNRRYWIVDPIDGTNNFVDGKDDFCIILGLMEKGFPVLGVVYIPVLREAFFASKGNGAWKRDGFGNVVRLRRPSKGRPIEQYRFARSFRSMKPFERSLLQSVDITDYVVVGSCGYKLSKIAQNEVDLYINWKGLHYWDLAVPSLVLSEAGGQVWAKDNHDPIRFGAGNYFVEGPVICMGHEKQILDRLVEANVGIA